MKKILYACFSMASLLVGANPAHAQTVANLNLETWASPKGVEAPANWQTTDDIFANITGAPQTLLNTGTVTKSTDAHGGTYAARLASVNSALFGMTVPGFLLLGTKVKAIPVTGTGTYDVRAGVPYAARPTRVQFYYKLNNAADQPGAAVQLTRTVNGVRQEIGSGSLFLTASTGYVQASIPVQYTASTQPDSITVLFTTGSANTAGTTLLVDDVTISSAALAVRADADVQAKLTVSPNPSTGGRFQLNAPDEPAVVSAPLTVSDLLGRTVAQQPALAVPSPTRELDLSQLASGIYVLRLDSKQGTVVRQLTIK